MASRANKQGEGNIKVDDKFQKNVEHLINCVEAMFGVRNDNEKKNTNITSSRVIIIDEKITSSSGDSGSTTNIDTDGEPGNTRSLRAGTISTRCTFGLEKDTPQWRKGGITKIFTDLGYIVGDKSTQEITLVDLLFPSDCRIRNGNNQDHSENSSQETQDDVLRKESTGARQRRFSPPRLVGTSRKTDNEVQPRAYANKQSNDSNRDGILNDFCKRIGNKADGQIFTTNLPAWGRTKIETVQDVGSSSTKSSESVLQEPAPNKLFKSANEQMILNDKAKGIKRPRLPPPGSGAGSTNVHVSGLRKMPRLDNESAGVQPQKSTKSDSDEGTDNPEVQELMLDERLKNVDAKMIEAILSEIIEVDTNTQWADIAGLHGPKAIIKEIIIWPLQRPDIFTGLRGPPKGVLLFGPPGTGKTLIGRLIATQSKSTFFNISASSLTSKWIGDGEKMVRALFQVARVKQPAVIFIDEIDSILTQRSDTEHESSRRLKTEFLIQFDGCSTKSEDRILVIGVTNRPQELDEAARRRLVKRIYIPLPDVEGRKHLVQRVLIGQNVSLEDGDFDKISEMTSGYSGADMASLVREAAYGPIRDIGQDIENISVDNVRPIQLKDFELAMNHVKASVMAEDLSGYEDWDRHFGSHV